MDKISVEQVLIWVIPIGVALFFIGMGFYIMYKDWKNRQK